METEYRRLLKRVVLKTIEEIGLEAFKSTSLFMSSRSVAKETQHADD